MDGIKAEKKSTCHILMSTGKICGRITYENDQCCIFHSEKKEIIQADFELALKQYMDQQKDSGKYDFTRFKFPAMTSFEKTRFQMAVTFSHASFGEGANFNGMEIAGDTDFSHAEFADTDFRGAIFGGNVNFSDATFGREAYFSRSEFKKNADFSDTIFERGAYFTGAALVNVNFRMASLEKKTDFRNATFRGKTDFSNAAFEGEVDFVRTNFKGPAIFHRENFLNTQKIFLYDAYFEDASGIFELLTQKRTVLKFFKKTEFLFGDFKFRLGQSSAMRYPLIDKRSRDAWYLEDFRNNHPFIYNMWSITSKCGASFSRWLLFSLAIALLFAGLYYTVYLICPGNLAFKNQYISTEWPFLSFFYYSIVTFTTLGFGEIIPTNAYSQLLVAIEVIIGYVMLGGLVSILANKLSRRY